MAKNNFERILSILKDLKFDYKIIDHPKSHSCNESKQFRDVAGLFWIWSKNIIFHCKWKYYLVTTHWDKQIKARNFRYEFWSKDIRFASQEEIDLLIKSEIWSIPPFWFENTEIPIYVDNEIFENEFFIFNPSDPYKSIQIKTSDLKNIYSNLGNQVKFFNHKEDEFRIIEN